MDRNQTPEQFEGTASGTPVAVSPVKERHSVIFRAVVKNADTSGSDVLGVSLDGGKIYFPLSPGQVLAESFVGKTIYVRAESGSPDYSIILFCG